MMRGVVLNSEELKRLYFQENLSVPEIAERLQCSPNKVNYWFKKYKLGKRSISEALYQRRNPEGDPFRFSKPTSLDEAFLLGLGIGLYWGEGNKRNRTTVRLGNTDPKLIRKFIQFLVESYGVLPHKFRFGLQIFSDMNPDKALSFWIKSLNVSKKQFGKVIVTPARGVGTYRDKTKHGVLTVYVSNIKLRDLLCQQIEKL